MEHEKVLITTGPRSGLPVVVAVHSTVLGQAVGGCRLWSYDDWRLGLEDALRLSQAMTMKSALAGLPLGGGKSVLPLPTGTTLSASRRRDWLLDLGDSVASFGGSYGVAEDVGTTPEDMLVVRERTEHVYGLPEEHGGMGDTSAPTAVGVLESIRATCAHLFGSEDLTARTVTVVGFGHVGARLADLLVQEGAKVRAADIDDAKATTAADLGVDWVPLDEACSVETDVLVPAALGGLLTPELVPALRCAAVVGPANNQLAADDVADLLAAQGVLWAPDFLVNAGGVVYGFHREFCGREADEALQHVRAIGTTLRDVLARAAAEGSTPLAAARAVALDRVAASGRSDGT